MTTKINGSCVEAEYNNAVKEGGGINNNHAKITMQNGFKNLQGTVSLKENTRKTL